MDKNVQISSDKALLDQALIHRFLSEEAAWSRGIPFERVARAIAGSLCFGAYLGDQQVGFARVISDGATFAYLADVFVLPAQRGRGISKALMAAVMAHPELQGLRRFMLATSTAPQLYAQYGFTPCARPEILMEKVDAEVYTRGTAKT
ncbi:GNAT family N-acetyltransferase [Paucibacter sp. KBW04]|uniref:GNAT family N-acetyltransferase n=1 Tax=Paucibacter sp. KBW04 TaxID=2153361 RepID=UPI000F58DC4D|nr:GNAT family N-acetyltransferase [Paucibacter sp. KBW04]RQO56039.1 GNAT family N-acetyltransferase [Paucibacter sp. KBW04]